MKNKLILLVIFLTITTNVKAQDPIFTQYFMVPETLNPGFTGFLETTTAGILHRTQWPDLNFRVDTDFSFFNTWIDEINSGVGVNIMNHREKFTNYSFTEINFNYAYRVQLSDEWFFRPAIALGFGNKSYGFQNILLEDQINIGSGTINTSSIDPMLLNEKLWFLDFSAGMIFNNENTWFGVSMKHLNKPNISFAVDGNTPLDMFFSANAGIEIPTEKLGNNSIFSSDTKILFTGNFMHQGQDNRLDLGTGLVFKQLFFGTTVATNPAKHTDQSHFLNSVNAYIGLKYEHLKFGYSYDINTSKIGNTGGVHEISVIYQFDVQKKCMGCPNYY